MNATQPCKYVEIDSGDLEDQISFLKAIKTQGPARSTKLCLTCWQILCAVE